MRRYLNPLAILLSVNLAAVTATAESPTSTAASAATASAATANEATRDVYFGNLHVHTGWSFDAFINGAFTDPDSAYRWAKGELIPNPGEGASLQIETPLDWYIVSDHAEYLGALPLMGDPDSPVSRHPLARDVTGDDAEKSFAAYTTISNGMYSVPPDIDPILGDPKLARSIWSQIVAKLTFIYLNNLS